MPTALGASLASSDGRAIGKTNEDGTDIASRPATVPDLFQTFCKALGLNPSTEMVPPQGRPVRIVDEGKPVSEVFP